MFLFQQIRSGVSLEYRTKNSHTMITDNNSVGEVTTVELDKYKDRLSFGVMESLQKGVDTLSAGEELQKLFSKLRKDFRYKNTLLQRDWMHSELSSCNTKTWGEEPTRLT